jgi:hypothetical protein
MCLVQFASRAVPLNKNACNARFIHEREGIPRSWTCSKACRTRPRHRCHHLSGAFLLSCRELQQAVCTTYRPVLGCGAPQQAPLPALQLAPLQAPPQPSLQVAVAAACGLVCARCAGSGGGPPIAVRAFRRTAARVLVQNKECYCPALNLRPYARHSLPLRAS